MVLMLGQKLATLCTLFLLITSGDGSPSESHSVVSITAASVQSKTSVTLSGSSAISSATSVAPIIAATEAETTSSGIPATEASMYVLTTFNITYYFYHPPLPLRVGLSIALAASRRSLLIHSVP